MVNGIETDQNFLNHFDLMKAGTLEFEMGDTPNKEWGTGKKSRPFSMNVD